MSRAGEDYERGEAEALYKRLEKKRQPYLDEARLCAALTIPYVSPPQSYRRTRAALNKPNQGLGARGVANLVGKFLTVLLPPGMPFYKVGLEPAIERDLGAQGEALGAVLQALSSYEMDIVTAIAQDGDRAGIAAGFLHVPIEGQGLLYLLPKGGVRHFGLDQWVIERRPDGQFVRIIVCEATPWYALHADHKEQLGPPPEGDAKNGEYIVEVYTHIYLDEGGKRVCEYQEAKGEVLEGSEGEYPLDACPWIPLRWAEIANEDYSRGLIELIYKDLKQYDELSEAIGDASKNAAKLLWLIQGGGGAAFAKRLAEAANGSFIAGDRSNVQALQQEKANDLQVAMKRHEDLKRDLSMAFLMGTTIQRSGDRVTKFEVEYLARELEAAYANEYTIIGREFQEPYFKAKTAQLRKRGVIASLPPKALKVQITTGIDALGRGSDQMRLETLAETAVKAGQVPEDLINPRELMRRSAANLGVKPDGLIPTEEEVAQRRAQQRMMGLAQQVAPEVARGMSQGALQRQAADIAASQSPSPEEPPTQ